MRALLAMAVLVASPAALAVEEYTFDTPSGDRWHYPFNFSPGFRTTASCFGTIGFPEFNNRDGIFLIAWDTSAFIVPGLDPSQYDIDSITVTVTNQANENVTPSWEVDTSADEWFTYDVNHDMELNGDGIPRGEPGDTDGESDDVDPGRPIELFGVGFGPTVTEAGWTEFTPYIGDNPPTLSARDPYPFVYQDGTLTKLHTEENVDGLHNEAAGVFSFTPVPWAVGVPSGYTPGAQSTPFDVTFDINLDLSDGEVKRYFQEQLSQGRVIVAVTALTETVQMGPSAGVPSFYTKEGVPLDVGAKAPSLVVTTNNAVGVGNAIPAVSTWGAAILTLLVLVGGTLILTGRRTTSQAA